MSNRSLLRDRRRGTLIGLAVGDALGAAVEFHSPGSFEPVTEYRAGGPHRLAAGQWTDDTSMALALADSIGRGWDLGDQLQRYCDWFERGKFSVIGQCFDIGITTCRALKEFLRGKPPRQCGDTSERASGNGSIMRLAPVPIRFHELFPQNLAELSRLAEESSLTTHASHQCTSAARYMAVLLVALIQGHSREDVLDENWWAIDALNTISPLEAKVLDVARGSFRRKAPPAIRGSGWVVQSLEAALWAFHDASTFEDAVLRAVNLGDDADTTGAVCGQLAGALWGESGIPQRLRDELDRKDLLEAALTSVVL